ncbi:hypothetical protein ACS0TY_026512 [Phlomoides rotata]
MPEEGWTMQVGTAWPRNNTRDHPGIIQDFLGHSGVFDTYGNKLLDWFIFPIRVSVVLTNGACLLNVDCDHYFNNSKALKEAMCFMMDPALGRKTCYINLKGLDGLQDKRFTRIRVDFRRRGLQGFQSSSEKWKIRKVQQNDF